MLALCTSENGGGGPVVNYLFPGMQRGFDLGHVAKNASSENKIQAKKV